MAHYVNKAIILGEITHEPKLRELSNGGIMLSFVVGTIRSWKNPSGEKVSAAEAHDCVIFGKFAEVCNDILGRGDMVYVEGVIETVKWVDENVEDRSRKQIRVRDVTFLTDRRGEENNNSNMF